MFNNFIHVDTVIHGDGGKRVHRLKAATAASAHVILLKQRPLRGWKDSRYLLHRPRAGQIFRVRAQRSLGLHERLQRADIEVIVLLNGRGLCFLAENSRK